jgi:molybdate transport system substrate-binding protein
MRRVAVAFVVLCVFLVGCSDDGDSKVRVFAAASLTEAFNASFTPLGEQDPPLAPEYTFAGSSSLVQQILDGAPADVFASADEPNMQKLVDAGEVETPQVFAHNALQIGVAPGNPKNIETLEDTQRDDVVLVLCDKAVPAGNYALQAYEKAGLPPPEAASYELDVKAAMTKLTSGEADAVIVYTTDVAAAGDSAEGVDIPEEDNVVTTYPIAVLKDAKNSDDAEAFVQAASSGVVQQRLQAAGFLAP